MGKNTNFDEKSRKTHKFRQKIPEQKHISIKGHKKIREFQEKAEEKLQISTKDRAKNREFHQRATEKKRISLKDCRKKQIFQIIGEVTECICQKKREFRLLNDEKMRISSETAEKYENYIKGSRKDTYSVKKPRKMWISSKDRKKCEFPKRVAENMPIS